MHQFLTRTTSQAYTAGGGALGRSAGEGCDLIEPIALPARFVAAPLFRRWSGDSQKLYFWLRARLDREEPAAPEEYRRLRGEGYLVAYSTADEMMDGAVDCSRNTLTKLIRELADLGVARVQPARRGYLFILGETHLLPLRQGGPPARVAVLYLDQLVADAAAADP